MPVQMKIGKSDFKINPNTCIVHCNGADVDLIQYASNLWEKNLGYNLSSVKVVNSENKNCISLKINPEHDDTISEEGYTLVIGKNSIDITANEKAGLFYGIQTLNQLIFNNPNGKIPCLKISDYPRFGYRGMHLDVSRHFMPIEFVYKLIDYMAMHKFNTFHWHLVDDQGWRLEIKKYPKLTEIGAWRVDMENRHWDDRPVSEAKSGPATYGGFYTQDQVRALVAYAAERNITVMPEIEMPAHVMSALAAYPEYSCSGENLGVPPGGVWPITHIYCAGNDKTFDFLEDVLSEVMELFASKYIHIGGDEADKAEWKKCPKCQKRIKKEGLKDEHELQSYFIKRIEKFLNQHDRILVGWDEILEGGLAQNAVVMSWRGEQGGIDAARMGNKAIMTPGSHCYFNHNQGDPALEPLAIGGNTTLKKVYDYEPIPSELTEEEGKMILGAQANLWSEFTTTPQIVEYMLFPRLAAISEVLWSPKGSKDWRDFSQRMVQQYKLYEKLGINYSLSAYQVKNIASLNLEKKALILEMQTEVYKPEIRYTIDGSEPNKKSSIYKKPIEISQSTTVRSAVFRNGELLGIHRTSYYNIHKAFAADIDIKSPNSPKYDGQGQHTLVNGIEGSISFSDGQWKGFSGDDMIANIDLGEQTNIQRISVDALQDIASWIFLPQRAIFEVSSDGETYNQLEIIEDNSFPSQGGKLIRKYCTSETAESIRYIRITLKNFGVCPKGHAGEGEPAWLFVSEIVVE